MFALSEEPISVESWKAKCRHEDAGAFVCFEGWVRNNNQGRQVNFLEYQAYADLALKEGQLILDEAQQRFDLVRAVCVHRVGGLDLGQLAVWIGVSAGHRDAAFEACRFIIEEIKTRLPIWKKEHYIEGDSGWVNCESASSASAPGKAL